MTMQDPLGSLAHLKLGREEYCQRLLTMLVLNGPYPRWNSRNHPCPKGERFLHALDTACFGTAGWPTPPVFVDEFELPKRHDNEAGGAPDYAVM